MIRKKLNIKGETLAETIIALSILAIGITIASTVILNSMRNLTNAKQRVVAVNIAREGIEAVRSIRDSNWLLYSDRRRLCWNHEPSAAAPCDGSRPIEPGVYVVYKHVDQSWRLQLDNGLGLVDLSLVDIDDTLIDSDGDEDFANDTDMYNHMDPAVTTPFGLWVKGTPFSRYIVIEYLENQPATPSDSIDTLGEWTALDAVMERPLLNRMRVSSVVEWRRTGAVHSVKLKTIITDHLGREDLAS